MNVKFFLPLIILAHLALLFFTRFTLWPEMVVYPYLLNNGYLLYKDIINPYPPLLPYSLALFSKLFGYMPNPYQALTWTIVVAVDIVIYRVAKKLSKNNLHALLSVFFFTLLSVPFGVNGLWFDLVQTPAIILSVYFTNDYLQNKRDKSLLISYFLITAAFVVKQQVLWLVVFYILYLAAARGKKILSIIPKYGIYLALAPAILFAHFIFFKIQGTSNDFLLWSIYFPFFKASQMPGYILLPTLRQTLSLLALVAFFLPTLLSQKTNKFIILCAIALFTFAYPRFDYFHLIPALSVFAVSIPQNLKQFKTARTTTKTLSILALIALLLFSARYTKSNITKEVRFFEKDIYLAANELTKATTLQD